MSKSESHKRAQSKAAGSEGRQEVVLPSGKRLDALSQAGRATEVERSPDEQALIAAATRLKEADANQRVLQVPQHNMDQAADAMRTVGVTGTVKNMSGTKRRSVR